MDIHHVVNRHRVSRFADIMIAVTSDLNATAPSLRARLPLETVDANLMLFRYKAWFAVLVIHDPVANFRHLPGTARLKI